MADLTKKKCFVISPIGPEGSKVRRHADEVLKHIIMPAMNECGLEAVRSDRLMEPGKISEQVFRHIVEDDLCIAIVTGQNANVFYELALAHSRPKPVILMAEKGTSLPFDIRDLRCVFYDLWPTEIKDRIYIQTLVAQVEEIKAANWTASPISVAFTQKTESALEAAAEMSSPLYTIIGVQGVKPVASYLFQSFQFDDQHNRNPLANLWADPQPGNYIQANLDEHDGERVMRVRFDSVEGYRPAVGVHPEGRIACAVPPNHTRLTFKAAVANPAEASPRLAFGVRVVNGPVEHWRYIDQNNRDAIQQFELTAEFKSFHIELGDADLWSPFGGAGRRISPGTRATFHIVCSVIFHFGTKTTGVDLGPGHGTVDIGEIRFTSES